MRALIREAVQTIWELVYFTAAAVGFAVVVVVISRLCGLILP